jgi:hypothetical protein
MNIQKTIKYWSMSMISKKLNGKGKLILFCTNPMITVASLPNKF